MQQQQEESLELRVPPPLDARAQGASLVGSLRRTDTEE